MQRGYYGMRRQQAKRKGEPVLLVQQGALACALVLFPAVTAISQSRGLCASLYGNGGTAIGGNCTKLGPAGSSYYGLIKTDFSPYKYT